MGDKTWHKIKEIEAQAAKIVKDAEQSTSHRLKQLNQNNEAALISLQKELSQEEKNLIQKAESTALKEVKTIEKQTKAQIKEIIDKAKPKLTSAKKEILKCPL